MRWMNRGARASAQAPQRETKHSRTGPLIALTSAGRARWTPRDYANLASEGFTKNPVVYRCVRMIAEAAASTGFLVFADGVRADDHPLARLLAKPNPEQSGPEWLEGVYAALQTAGNAYVEAVGDRLGEDGAPEELWSLRPDRVAIVPGRAGWPEAYEYTVDGRSVRIVRGAEGCGVEHTVTLHCVSRFGGSEEARAICAAVRTRLEGAQIEADGVRTISLRTTFADVFRSGDLRRTYGVIRVRAVTEEI